MKHGDIVRHKVDGRVGRLKVVGNKCIIEDFKTSRMIQAHRPVDFQDDWTVIHEAE